MKKRNFKSFRSNLQAIILGVVDVAHLSANLVREVIDGTSDLLGILTLVSGDNKSVTTSECIEIIILPTFNEIVVPHSLLLASSDGDIEELVELGLGVIARGPKRFTILGIIATIKALLSSVVDDRDTSREESEHKSVAILPSIRLDGKETGLIVVINEGTKNAGILEVLFIVLETIAKVTHGLAVSKDIAHGEEHGIAEDAIEAALIARHISNITVVVFTDCELADGLLKLLPEGLLNLSDCVDTQAIAVVGCEFFDVLDEILADERVGLIQIRKARETAVFDLGLVVPVLDVAASWTAIAIMVVFNAVEGDEITVASVLLGVTHVVTNDINHEVHATVMEGILQVDEVRKSTEVLVDSGDVLGPVSMIALVGVLDDGADPDCIKAHTLDVVEFIHDALEHTATVSGQIARRRRG